MGSLGDRASIEGDKFARSLIECPPHPRVHGAGRQCHPPSHVHHCCGGCPTAPTYGRCLLAEPRVRWRPEEEAGAGGHAGGRLFWQRHCSGRPEQ